MTAKIQNSKFPHICNKQLRTCFSGAVRHPRRKMIEKQKLSSKLDFLSFFEIFYFLFLHLINRIFCTDQFLLPFIPYYENHDKDLKGDEKRERCRN